jgi:hypothetical protein
MFFRRDTKFYIGPLSDSQIDSLQARPELRSSGIACIAGNGKVETYLTIPIVNEVNRIVDIMRQVGVRA